MKAKHFVYVFFALALIFAGTAAYFFFLGDTGSERRGYGVDTSIAGSEGAVSESRSRPISGKPGNLLIAYAGDIKGSLLPCG